jgi:hypothetical protein
MSKISIAGWTDVIRSEFEFAARVDGVVVGPLRDLDERDGLRVQRVGDLRDERAVLAGSVRLEDVEAQRGRLPISGPRLRRAPTVANSMSVPKFGVPPLCAAYGRFLT